MTNLVGSVNASANKAKEKPEEGGNPEQYQFEPATMFQLFYRCVHSIIKDTKIPRWKKILYSIALAVLFVLVMTTLKYIIGSFSIYVNLGKTHCYKCTIAQSSLSENAVTAAHVDMVQEDWHVKTTRLPFSRINDYVGPPSENPNSVNPIAGPSLDIPIATQYKLPPKSGACALGNLAFGTNASTWKARHAWSQNFRCKAVQ